MYKELLYKEGGIRMAERKNYQERREEIDVTRNTGK